MVPAVTPALQKVVLYLETDPEKNKKAEGRPTQKHIYVLKSCASARQASEAQSSIFPPPDVLKNEIDKWVQVAAVPFLPSPPLSC